MTERLMTERLDVGTTGRQDDGTTGRLGGLISNKTLFRPIRSVMLIVITKSDSRCAVVRLCYHSCDKQTELDSTKPILLLLIAQA